MNKLSLVCILGGVFAILTRGPLIFAPEATMRLIRKLTVNNTRVRLLGLFILFFGFALSLAARDSSLAIGQLIFILGFLVAFVSILLLLIFPAAYRQVIDFVSDFDTSVLRTAGFLGVVFGAFFLYLGFVEFWADTNN